VIPTTETLLSFCVARSVGGTYQIKSIDQFLDCKRLIWHMLLRKIQDGVRKQRIIGTLAVCNARETMLQKIEQEGILVNIVYLIFQGLFCRMTDAAS
jgi:hypothetical protein